MKLLRGIAAVVFGASLALCQSQPTIKATRIQRSSPASGKEMFDMYCAVCHAKDGKGGGPAAAALKKSPGDLTQLTKKNNGKFPGPAVAQSINGEQGVLAHGSKDMPIWGELFRQTGQNESEVRLRIANLARYIEAMQAK
ncbi:MAG: c-type cytochrome [Bryobacteraceae bacterium]|nr:c-type cytochrome [Bryobacteraceae bacterium]